MNEISSSYLDRAFLVFYERGGGGGGERRGVADFLRNSEIIKL